MLIFKSLFLGFSPYMSVLQKKPKAEDLRTECATCKGTGDNENLVR